MKLNNADISILHIAGWLFHWLSVILIIFWTGTEELAMLDKLLRCEKRKKYVIFYAFKSVQSKNC